MAKKRATAITDENLEEFYDLIESTIDRLDLRNKPQNIYNCDETNFNGLGKTTKVFAPKGLKRVNKLSSDNEKINYTVQVNNIRKH